MLLAVAGTTSGCLWAPGLVLVRKEIERQLPGTRFEKEIELTIGPVSLVFVRLVTRLVPDAREASDYLRDLSRVELAIYNTKEAPPNMTVSMPEQLQKLQEREDWELAVKVRDDDGLLCLLYRIDGDSVREVYIVSLSDDDLVLVKAQGRLERLVALALSESGTMKGIGDVEDPGGSMGPGDSNDSRDSRSSFTSP
jgi:hypothetical protein